ncbi:MAG: arginine--tRNA ligase [Schleiferiaceae bacterium]|nr:arginine--tRNA ligase [Schleiferiaceae bacterium]
MINTTLSLKSVITDLLKDLFGDHNLFIDLQETRKEFKGDLTLVIFPFLKVSKLSPEATGDLIGSNLLKRSLEVKNYNVVKGFLNLTLTDQVITTLFDEIKRTNNFGLKDLDPLLPSAMIEYSSPNTNKPLHLGHIRNNLLGDSISRIVKASGRNVIQVQIINDRGVHICKSMWAWKKFGDGETPKSSGLKGDHLVGKYYVLFDKEYKRQINESVLNGKEQEEAKKTVPCIIEVQKMLLDWESGDKEVVELWTKMNTWVYSGFKKTYERLGIVFDKNYYESETYILGKKDIIEGLENGVFYRKPDNSVWIDLSAEGLDEKIVLRKDGSSVYMTQDIGTAIQRFKDFEIDSLTYVVGNEQDYHFRVLFLILEKLGYPWARKLRHLSYGMVDLPSGKMKSREGKVVDADDLMDEMESAARKMSIELGKSQSLNNSESEILDKVLGHGALKYFILKVDPKKRMIFNPEESIDFNGNTGPFLQYTHARITSLINKKGSQVDYSWDQFKLTKKERGLVILIAKFPQNIQVAAAGLNPSVIAAYLYELAKGFNSFYQQHSVLNAETALIAAFRVDLCKEVANVLNSGLNILGINAPERM